MRSLTDLCSDNGFSENQKKYFAEEVDALLEESGMDRVGALFYLSRLWQHYDVGGHSMGRSLRALILEKIRAWLMWAGGVPDEQDIQKAKTALSVLVAMHYDYRYINQHGWFDYHIEDVWDLPIRDRILVSAAAIAFGIDDIPSADDWSDERIIAFLNV